jgi:hypothetical protein
MATEPSKFVIHKRPNQSHQSLSSDDTVKFAIADRDGHIVVFFDKRISWFEMPDMQAIEFAISILDRAGAKYTVHKELDK